MHLECCLHLIFLMNKFKFEIVSIILLAERQWDFRSFYYTRDSLYIQPSGRERKQVSQVLQELWPKATRAGGQGGAAARWPPSRPRKRRPPPSRGPVSFHSLETPESAGRGVVWREMSLLRGGGVAVITELRYRTESGVCKWVNDLFPGFPRRVHVTPCDLVTPLRSSPASPALAARSTVGTGGYFLAIVTGDYCVVGKS